MMYCMLHTTSAMFMICEPGQGWVDGRYVGDVCRLKLLVGDFQSHGAARYLCISPHSHVHTGSEHSGAVRFGSTGAQGVAPATRRWRGV